MIKYLKEHLFQFISLIPVSFIAIGSFVLNIYLNQFGIIDVALFDSRTIFVGFITVFQLIAFFCVFCIFIEKITTFHGIMSLIISMTWKPILFSIIVYMYSGNMSNIKNIYTDWRYNLTSSISVLSISSFICLFFIRDIFLNWKTNVKSDKFFACFFIIIAIISSYIAFILLCKDIVFKEIWKMYMYFSIACAIYYIPILSKKFPFINPEKKISLFKQDGTSFEQDRTTIKFYYFFVILYLLVLFVISLTYYSKKVFPYISSNMGGGYYKYNTIILDDDSLITGKIIHSNANFIYIIEEENKLSQYPINKIKSYEIKKDIEIIEDSIVVPEMENVEKEESSEVIENNIEQ